MTKPTILFVIDTPHWAHDYKAKNIIDNLKDHYQFKINYHNTLSKADLLEADLVIIFYWIQLRSNKKIRSFFKKHPYKCILGVCSHYEIENKHYLNAKKHLSKANAIFAHNPKLFKNVARFNRVNYYTPNGVNTSYFHPSSQHKHPPPFLIGWAGNPNISIKNYHTILKPTLQNNPMFKLVEATSITDKKTLPEMREFYQDLDLYICTSSTEGTPNPCLEAAACGIPIITTAVGNMPELIKEGVNGFFIEPTIESIHNVLKKIEKQPTLLNEMKPAIRKSSLDFDWEKQAKNYNTLFQESLNRIPLLKQTHIKPASKLFSFIKKKLRLQ